MDALSRPELSRPELSRPELSRPELSSAAFDVVAIGTSLGGLKALRFLLSALPHDFPLPIVIVQHLSPDFPSCLHEMLDRRSRLFVRQAQEGQPLHAGSVYTAPPGRHLIITPQRTLSLMDGPRINFSLPALDPLFHSVAAAYQERSIGIVLTGANSDGVDGIRAIRRCGGTTIAQDKETSEAFRMPGAAINTGCINFVLPLERIAPALIALAMVQGASAFFSLPPSARYPLVA